MDFEKLGAFFGSVFGLEMQREDAASSGANFGEISLKNKNLVLSSADARSVLELKLDNIVQCVIPPNSRDEIEFQFQESDNGDREADTLVQITLHLPVSEDAEEDLEGDQVSSAERLQQEIMTTGVIQSATGNVLVEFSKEQVIGNYFVVLCFIFGRALSSLLAVGTRFR